MGLFGNSTSDLVKTAAVEEQKRMIKDRVRNSEGGKEFFNYFCELFNKEEPYIRWLMSGSRREMHLQVFRNGIVLTLWDFKIKESKVGNEFWGFGAAGYKDLPNKEYVDAFSQLLYEQIKNNCPKINITGGGHISLAPGAKKDW